MSRCKTMNRRKTMDRRRDGRWTILVPSALALVFVLVTSGCSGTPWPDNLETVAHPDLGAIEEAARRQLESQRTVLEQLVENGRGEILELAKAFGQMGRLYHAYQLHEPSAACYRNAQKLDPDGFLWPYHLGLLEQANGRFTEALNHFERSLEIGPDNSPARLRAGALQLDLNDAQGARVRFEPLAGDERYAAVVHAGLGRAALSEGDAERAVTHFEKALELAPEAGGIHPRLAVALRQLGRADEAAWHLEKKGAGEAGFPDPLAERLKELAVSSGSYLRRGNKALMVGETEKAIVAYEKAVEVAPTGVEARRNLALALTRAGRAAEAVRHLEAAIDLQPDDGRLYFDLGNAHQAAGATKLAIAAYEKAVEMDPEIVAGRFNLANVLAEQSRWAEAGEHLAKVLELEPDHGRARYLEAMSRHHQNRSAEAVARLETLLADDAVNVPAIQGLATIQFALKRPRQALAVYDAALAREDLPATAKAALTRQAAQQAWRVGRRQEAVGYFRRGVELEPSSSEAHTQLANVLQLSGQRAEAIEIFARAVELDPGNATAWLSRASLLIVEGDFADARSVLDQALTRQPEHLGLAHTLARLLATCPDGGLRDGQRAYGLAQRVFQTAKSLEHSATVAMALAELGRFEEAIQWQRGLARQASTGTPRATRQRIAHHLELYENRRPVRIGEVGR